MEPFLSSLHCVGKLFACVRCPSFAYFVHRLDDHIVISDQNIDVRQGILALRDNRRERSSVPSITRRNEDGVTKAIASIGCVCLFPLNLPTSAPSLSSLLSTSL